MKCTNCKHDLAPGAKFCPECGTEVKKACPNPDCTCEDIPDEAQFCPECGTKRIVDLTEIERKKKLQLKQKREKLIFRIAIIAGFIAILIITIVFVRNYIQKREYEIQLKKEELAVQKEEQAKLDIIKEQITNVYPIEMVTVQGGTFQMGSLDGEADEKTLHNVTVSTFQIGKTEITQAQWESVMGANPSYFKGTNLPVENVSWDDVQSFIEILNLATGKKYRLPTEAEWEYSARGGSQSKGYLYAGSNNFEEVAVNNTNGTRPTGSKKSNELGLYDMSGNVWEWCSDIYGEYKVIAQTNPTGPTSGSCRVYRGGSWNYNAQDCRVANRNGASPYYRFNDLGFRLVCLP